MNVGPTFINSGFFPGSMTLLKALQIFTNLIFVFYNITLYILFKALHLLFLANFQGPMFIICPTFIPNS